MDVTKGNDHSNNKCYMHMQNHSKISPYSCPNCSLVFTRKEHLMKHRKIKHLEYSNMPEINIEGLGNEDVVIIIEDDSEKTEVTNKPVKSKKNYKIHSCKSCGKFFDDFTSLNKHSSENCIIPIKKNMFTNKSNCSTIKFKMMCKRNKKFKFKQLLPKKLYSNYFICGICGRKFVSKMFLNKHRRSHEEETVTELISNEKIELTEIKLEDFDSSHSCPLCEECFTEKSQYIEHIALHIEDTQKSHSDVSHKKTRIAPIFRCNNCGLICKGLSRLRDHERTHTDERPHQCSLCGLSFRRKQHLIRHETNHTVKSPKNNSVNSDTVEKLFACDKCPRLFKHHCYLTSHLRSHDSEKSRMCRICTKVFTRPRGLMYHMRIHTGEKPHVCDVCSRAYSSPSALRSHSMTHSPQKRFKKHTCSVCSLGVLSLGDLQVHMRTHTGEKPYVCSICGRGFARSTHLKGHMKVHADERDIYQCEICLREYNRKEHLTRHLKTHSEDGGDNRREQRKPSQKAKKPVFQCPLCPVQYDQKEGLTRHLKLHDCEDNPRRLYRCSFCSKEFKHKGLLDTHVKIHKDESASHFEYECHLCQKGFLKKVDLVVHLKSHNYHFVVNSGDKQSPDVEEREDT